MEYFEISDEHYLAVANGYNGVTHRLNSVIYRWNGKLFVAFQNLTTQRANGFSFFIIDKESFLAVSNLYDDVTNSINSVIYRWKNKRFELFQEVATDGSNRSVAFLINNATMLHRFCQLRQRFSRLQVVRETFLQTTDSSESK